MDFENETKSVCLTYLKLKSEQSGDLQSLVLRCDEALKSGVIADDTVLKNCHQLAASLLRNSTEELDEQIEGEVVSMAEDLKVHKFLTQDRYNKAVKKAIKKNSAESLEDINTILQILFTVLKNSGVEYLSHVIDLAVMSFMLIGQKIIQEKKGWFHLLTGDNMDLSSSIVFVEKDQQNLPETTEEETENFDGGQGDFPSTPSTPPFSIIPPQDETRDSMDSATPPEFVEKPANLTASLLKLIGDEGSKNTDPDTPVNTPIEGEIPEEPVDLTPIIVGDQPEDEPPTANQEEGLCRYIPHISLGVAAAAALVGIYALKK